MGDDLAELSDLTTRALLNKQDRPRAVPCAIPISGWLSDTALAEYTHYYDMAVDGLTPRDRADIVLSPNSAGTARACGLCPTTETLSGAVRIRADSVPPEVMTGQLVITTEGNEGGL